MMAGIVIVLRSAAYTLCSRAVNLRFEVSVGMLHVQLL
jgi:hypothetical protein